MLLGGGFAIGGSSIIDRPGQSEMARVVSGALLWLIVAIDTTNFNTTNLNRQAMRYAHNLATVANFFHD